MFARPPADILPPFQGDPCNYELNFAPDVQVALDTPLENTEMMASARRALAHQGIITPRHVLVAGLKYIHGVTNLGAKGRQSLLDNPIMTELPIQLQVDPLPEHVAHFCPDLNSIGAAALIGRIVEDRNVCLLRNPNITVEGVLDRELKPGDISSLYIRPTYGESNPYGFENPRLYEKWNHTTGAGIAARYDGIKVHEFYRRFSLRLGNFVERFEEERERLTSAK